MSDKHLRSPDERWETISKGNTRDTEQGYDKNKPKPDELKAKGEIMARDQEEDEAEEEE